MSEWWEKPYKGGPMAIPSSYFPRPLYPPDAANQGKKASQDGPDVLAYKRTLSRAGRWMPWEPANWDDSFNNQFSHGKPGGGVKDSGIAGFQRQMGITPDSGFVGKQTFNALASIRVPEGLPHAGEMAMDANACNLIGEAWAIYAKPPEAPRQTTRERALAGAIKWLGYKEDPPGSNNSTFGIWYGMNYQPWCAFFVSYCYEVEAGGSPHFAQGAAYSYVPYIVSNAQRNQSGLSVTFEPIPGDLVCYDWGRDGVADHVGIFESGTVDSFKAIEGNTSTSNQSNGGEVMRRQRTSHDATITFVRVAEP